ncbi:conserved membrane hypothetical protein [Candidatus Desulfarcum epimagneticum]|uniref:ABC transporter permease n=1 Tax=uncultured Desulfobacteraceae bacterium TaxID=218296 RepID=A0A484HJB9_9BACT|nr:conserved membrane hypothetical protein [uncultured Desulfobacteraceae bacterium]
MTHSVQALPLAQLALAFIPALAVICVLWRWGLNYRNAIHGLSRMLGQLLLIGYFLVFLFESDQVWIILGVLSVMVLVSSWIALRTVRASRAALYGRALISITAGGGLVLALVVVGVLRLDPWHLPRYLIPLAGMIFSNAMNSVSLAADRMGAEIKRGVLPGEARSIAFRASLIPITNSLFAVGLVAIPGMMTGQILTGASPLLAARYQIMVMCMVYGASGISSALFLFSLAKKAPGIFIKGAGPEKRKDA